MKRAQHSREYAIKMAAILCLILYALSGCGGGGGGGGTPAGGAPPAAGDANTPAQPAPEAADLNMKEAGPAALEPGGQAVAFSAPAGAPVPVAGF